MTPEPASLPFHPDKTLTDYLGRFPRLEAWFDILMSKPRAGWSWRGVPVERAETIGEHSRKLYAGARLYPGQGLDRDRMGLLAYFHDIGEAIIPDITMHDNVSKAEKFELEKRAVHEIAASLGPGGDTLIDLWMEQETRQTPEGVIVHQLDQLDGFVMAVNYYRQGYNIDDYVATTERWLKDPLIHSLYERIFAAMDEPGDAYEIYAQGLRDGMAQNRMSSGAALEATKDIAGFTRILRRAATLDDTQKIPTPD